MSVFLTAYYRPKPGGLCKRLFRGIRVILERGHSVHYVAVREFPIQHPDCHFHRLWWPASWRTDSLPFWLWLHLSMPWVLLVVGLRHRVDGLFTFSVNYGALMLPLRLVLGVDYRVFMRGDTQRDLAEKGAGRLVRALDRVVERLALWNADVSFVSEAFFERVSARLPAQWMNRAAVLPNEAPEPNQLAPKWAPPLQLAAVGVLNPVKNTEFLLDVMSRGDLAGTDQWHLNVYGTGEELDNLERSVRRRQLGARVHFHGWVDVATVWRSSHLLVHPALHDEAPNAVLEALSHGCPVIVHQTPELKELVGAGGLSLPLEAAAWAEAIAQFCADPAALKRLSQAAVCRARALNFDWEQAFFNLVSDDSHWFASPSTPNK